MSISLGLRARTAVHPRPDDVIEGTPQPSARDASDLGGHGGALRPRSLRFLDQTLERRYQQVSGAESLTGFRIATGADGVLWRLPAVVDTTGARIPIERAVSVCFAVAALNWAAFVLADGLKSLDQQHAVLSIITSMNGLVLLRLAATGGGPAGR